MSATDYSTMPAAELFTEFERLTKELDAVRKALKKVMKVKRAAKTDPSTGETVKRAPTAWIAWTKYVKDTYAEEYAEFAAAQETKKGVLPAFAKQCRDATHTEEWAEFEATHKAAHPPAEKAAKAPKAAKTTAAAVAALLSDTEDEGVSVRSGAGAGAGMPKASSVGKTKKAAKEEKPKKEKKPASKAAAAAVAALLSDSEDEAPKKVVREHVVEEDEEEEELTPFTLKGVVYLQNNLGHAWVQTKAGGQGKWAGLFNGVTLDTAAPNPYEDEE